MTAERNAHSGGGLAGLGAIFSLVFASNIQPPSYLHLIDACGVHRAPLAPLALPKTLPSLPCGQSHPYVAAEASFRHTGDPVTPDTSLFSVHSWSRAKVQVTWNLALPFCAALSLSALPYKLPTTAPPTERSILDILSPNSMI